MLKKSKIGVICLECGAIMASWFRHDFRKCPCGNQAFIDGGEDYTRYGACNVKKLGFVRITELKVRKRRKKK